MAVKPKSCKEDKCPPARVRLFPSWRLVITFTCMLGATTAMFGRVQTSFAVLCMIEDQTAPPPQPVLISNSSGLQDVSIQPSQGEFGWSKQYQGVVLSAYFYGYVAALVIGGMLADKYPSHRVAIASAVSQSVLMLLMPEMTRLHPYAMIILRVLQGVVAAAFYPSFNVILGKWTLDGEYALLFAIAWSGGYIGSALAFPVSGALCQSTFLGGWPAIFYVSGTALMAWAVVATLLMTESPEQHRFVSASERSCLMAQATARPKVLPPTKPVSIRTLLGNLQVWIISLSYFASSWFFAALNITLPTFMKEGFDFDISENGFMSAMPSITMAVLIVVGGKSFDYLHLNKGVSTTNARKILSLIGLLLPSFLMTVMLLLPSSQRYFSVALISLAQGFSSFVICSGPVSAAKEIAPQHMGVIWGLASSIGNTTGFLAPIIAALMTPNGTLQEWCWFFVIAIVMMVLLSVLIGCCWKSEIQPFAKLEEERWAVASKKIGQVNKTFQDDLA